LQVEEDRLELCSIKNPKLSPLFVDFLTGSTGYRLSHSGGTKQQLAKAVGIKGKFRPSVWDVTAGLGVDGIILATLGCQVHLIERSPTIFALLQDGLQRVGNCRLDGDRALPLQEIIKNFVTLELGDAQEILKSIPPNNIDVIYLDPMFPESRKTALTKREMQVIRDIVGMDVDSGALLALALEVAKKRVVVKRPRLALSLPGSRSPDYIVQGTRNRYDVYLIGGN